MRAGATILSLVLVLGLTACATGGVDRAAPKPGSALEKAYLASPKDPEAALRYAESLRRAGSHSRAVAVLTPAAQGGKATPGLLTELAQLTNEMAQYKAAQQWANKAINKDKAYGPAYNALGTAMAGQNNHKEAEAAFRSALEKWTGDRVPVMNNLALALANQEKLDEALSILQEAKKLAPSSRDVERNLRIFRTLRDSSQGAQPAIPTRKPI